VARAVVSRGVVVMMVMVVVVCRSICRLGGCLGYVRRGLGDGDRPGRGRRRWRGSCWLGSRDRARGGRRGRCGERRGGRDGDRRNGRRGAPPVKRHEQGERK
jgi:hypothetical protein